MRTACILITVALLGLAGCTTPTDDTDVGPGATTTTAPPTTTTSAPPATTTTTTTTTARAPQNQAPTASLSASIEQGQIPFDVTFDMGGGDADGDALSWTLDADGDGEPETEGTTLPSTYTHTYDGAGNRTATLTVSDGRADATAQVTIRADGAGATGPLQTADVEWTAFFPGMCPEDHGLKAFPNGGNAQNQETQDGVLYAIVEVDPATWGLPFNATFTMGGPSLNAVVHFNPTDGSVTVLDRFQATTEPWELSGTVPQDAGWAVLSACSPQGASATYAAG